MQKIFIGIDPGKQGFLALCDQNREYHFFKMPFHKVDSGKFLKSGKPQQKTEFHVEGFKNLIQEIKTLTDGFEICAVVEKVTGRSGWSAEANFNFGYVAGLQRMILVMLGAKTELVRPQLWQGRMYQGVTKTMIPSSTGKTMVHDTKATSAKVAQKIAPEIDFRKTEKSKNIDDNKTDAFLMCEFAKKHFKK